MKTTTVLLLLFGLILLSGCTRHYIITTNSGAQISTQNKPQYKNGVYVYKDALGRDGVIPAGTVAAISPASMTEDDTSRDKLPPLK